LVVIESIAPESCQPDRPEGGGIHAYGAASISFMRIMFCTRSGAGHLGPLVPFAKAFLRDNDDVVVAAPLEMAGMVAAAGLDHHPLPDPPQDGRGPLFDKARHMDPHAANVMVVSDIFVRIDTRAAYAHVVAAVESFRPDVMLIEATDFAAALAAEATGTPAVTIAITLARLRETLAEPVDAALDEVRADLGLPPGPGPQRPYFTLMPAELEDPEMPGPADAIRFREGVEDPRPLPSWWANTAWPLVYLTFGSVAPTVGFFPEVYRETLAALAPLAVRVLVTVGRQRDPRELGPLPPNVHAARWVPQADVMPHATAMICHGGSGTVRAGLAAGVPMAVLPLFADQFDNARRVAELGAGIAVDRTAGLGDAVRRLIAEPAYRASAQRIAHSMEQLPPVDAATAIVRELVRVPV
jgi:UDP:flavonoid glycosyltransferase YjiC (YdhE family)